MHLCGRSFVPPRAQSHKLRRKRDRRCHSMQSIRVWQPSNRPSANYNPSEERRIMIAAFTIIYCATIVVAFKVIKIKPRPVPIAVAVVVGVLFIGAIVIGWQFSAPVTKSMTLSRYVVQIVPEVSGTIKKIHAHPNVPLKKDRDLLFEIEPELFQYQVDRSIAQLAAAQQNILQLEAGVEAAA